MAVEVIVAVRSGTLLHALRVQLNRRVSARRGGGDYNEVLSLLDKVITRIHAQTQTQKIN